MPAPPALPLQAIPSAASLPCACAQMPRGWVWQRVRHLLRGAGPAAHPTGNRLTPTSSSCRQQRSKAGPLLHCSRLQLCRDRHQPCSTAGHCSNTAGTRGEAGLRQQPLTDSAASKQGTRCSAPALTCSTCQQGMQSKRPPLLQLLDLPCMGNGCPAGAECGACAD